MSSTRLLLLGVVKIFQPVHGYFVRRELLSWRADEWANINPGSIYNGLRTLTRDGFLDELPGGDARGRERARYRLTPDGEKEFLATLHEALWTLEGHDSGTLFTAVGFMNQLRRDDVLASLEVRIAQIEATRSQLELRAEGVIGDPTTTPGHVAEVMWCARARLGGELQWCREVCDRIRAGQYVFAGEDGPAISRA